MVDYSAGEISTAESTELILAVSAFVRGLHVDINEVTAAAQQLECGVCLASKVGVHVPGGAWSITPRGRFPPQNPPS